jgi:CO/xanthine dehydrogenase Mo-binding subunit
LSFKTAPVHQAYIEPQGCVARCDADGQRELWSSSQGHFVVRAYTAQLLGMKLGDTASVGYTHLTGGSRVTFATGMAVVDTAKKLIQELCVRAAKMWDVDPEGVVWEEGCARPASSNVGDFEPLSLSEIAAKRAQTGAPIVAAAAVNPSAVARRAIRAGLARPERS